MKNLIDTHGVHFLNENRELTKTVYEGDLLKLINSDGIICSEIIVNSFEDIKNLINSATSPFDTLHIKSNSGTR